MCCRSFILLWVKKWIKLHAELCSGEVADSCLDVHFLKLQLCGLNICASEQIIMFFQMKYKIYHPLGITLRVSLLFSEILIKQLFRNFVSLIGDFLTEFFKLCRRKESTDEILGRSAFEEEGKGKTKILMICVI